MRRSSYKILGLAGLFFLAGCNQTNGPRKLDIVAVMDRTIETIVDYTQEIEASGQSTESPSVMQGFYARLHKALNSRPDPFTNGTLGIRVNDDASFEGFDDPNKNNVQDEGEQYLFKLEFDTENERVIATDFADNVQGTTFRDGQHRGFFFIWVSRRHQAAGLNPGRFANRNIATRMKPVRTASTGLRGKTTRARSRARSGGARSGK